MVTGSWKMRWHILDILNACNSNRHVIMLWMQQLRATYCSLKNQDIPFMIPERLRMHFANEKLLIKSSKKHVKQSMMDQLWCIRIVYASQSTHPWWQLQGCAITKLCFSSHFRCMILAPLNQRFQNNFGRFSSDLTLLFTLWVSPSWACHQLQ